MPRGDRTGPMGMGSMTGRAAGFCAGFNRPGYVNPAGGGRGMGLGRGAGRGYRNQYYATGMPGWARGGYGLGSYSGYAASDEVSPEQEASMLQNQAAALKQQLEGIEGRLKSLEQSKKE